MTQNENERVKPTPIDLSVFLGDCLRGLCRSWAVLLVIVVVLAAIGGARSYRNYRPMYRCSASFTVTSAQSEDPNYSYSYYYDQSTASQMAATFPYLVRSDLLNSLLKEDLGVSQIPGTANAVAIANSNLFTLSVVSANPQDALNVLEAVIRNYPKVAQYVTGATALNIIDAPRLPTEPYNQRQWANAAVKWGILGVLLYGLGLAVYALTRDTIRKEEEISRKLALPCMGAIPAVVFKQRSGKTDKRISLRNDRTGTAFQEGCRSVAIKLLAQTQDAKVIGVTGATLGEGSTTVARNLTQALAENGKRVILIHADFLHPGKVSREKGLERFLAGECPLSDVLERTEGENIWTTGCSRVLTVQELTAFDGRLSALVSSARTIVDFVILDLPAADRLDRINRCLELCEGVVFVIRQDNLKLSRLMDAVEELSRYGAKLLGCVLNMVTDGLGGGYYGYYGYGRYGGYHSYYGYGKSKRRKE